MYDIVAIYYTGRSGFGREYRASYIHNTDMDTGQNEAMEKDVVGDLDLHIKLLN